MPTIDIKTIRLTERLNTTGKFEFTYIERPSGRKRYKSTGASDLAQAETFVSRLKGDLQDHLVDKLIEPTFREVVDLYLGSVSFGGDETSYRRKAAHILSRLGDRRLSTLTTVDLDLYSAERLKACVKGTLRNDLGVLGTAQRFAVKRKYIPKEKVGDLIEIERPAEPRWSNRTALSEADVNALWGVFQAYRPHNVRKDRLTRIARFGALLIDTGARRGAIEGLRWTQIDFNLRQINFRTADDPDNKRRAICPMSPRLFEILRQAWQERIGDWVLDEPTRIKGAWDNCLAGTGFEEVHPHLFRHSFITHQIMRGVEIVDVAKIVNDDPKTLYDRYIHLKPDYLHTKVKWSDEQKRAVVALLKAAE